MNERVCLVCGRPASPGSTHPACEFCGGVLETIGETFCPSCAASRDAAPPPPRAFTLHPLVREVIVGARNGVITVVGFMLLRSFEFRGELCLLAVLLLAPIATTSALFTNEAAERRERWSLRSLAQTVGMLLSSLALAWSVWSTLR